MAALACLFLLATMAAPLGAAEPTRAEAIRERHAALADALAHNQFRRPLHLQSTESSAKLEGDIYAKLDYSFARVNNALNDPVQGPANWCNVLILHLNTKYCYAATEKAGKPATVLKVNIGKKVQQSLQDAYRVEFNYRVVEATADYFQVEMVAERGPLSTRDYRIMVEAVAIDAEHTFLHLTYSYSYGMAGRLAMKTYLATIGRDKVGFTLSQESKANGVTKDHAAEANLSNPSYIGGVRGVVERNTMRYYLAIDAYLSAIDTAPAKQLDKRLQTWFSATEQYARQLHEVERSEYMEMKHQEYQRQQSAL